MERWSMRKNPPSNSSSPFGVSSTLLNVNTNKKIARTVLLVTKHLGKDEGIHTKALSYQSFFSTAAGWVWFANGFSTIHECITKYSF